MEFPRPARMKTAAVNDRWAFGRFRPPRLVNVVLLQLMGRIARDGRFLWVRADDRVD